MGEKERNTESNEKNNTVSVEIALRESTQMVQKQLAKGDVWGEKEKDTTWSRKKKWESETINIHVMNNSLTSRRLFIGQLSKTGGNCIYLSMFIRDVKLLKICEMKHNDVISSLFELRQDTHVFQKREVNRDYTTIYHCTCLGSA